MDHALHGRPLEIASGRAGLSRSKVLRYRAAFAERGLALPELEQPPATPRRRHPVLFSERPKGLRGPFHHVCAHLGHAIATEPCRCGSSSQIAIHHCAAEPGRCIPRQADYDLLRDPARRASIQCCASCPLRQTTPRFISTAQLWEDVKTLVSSLPPDVSLVIGVARSGLNAATMIAMLLHRPLSILRQSTGDLIDGGNGWRLSGNTGAEAGRVVVVDDTVMTGNSLAAIQPIVRGVHPESLFAAVYVNPLARHQPDLWAADLPWPHLLEWNLFNSVLSPHCAVDFDGILCHDCPPGDDDDGPRYAKFLEQVLPLYYVRKTTIPLIVTARLEKYRPQTLAWLARHGMRVDQLVMGPWRTNAQRARADVAAFKAEHYAAFLQKRHHVRPPLFIESDSRQAQRIAELARGIVVCPAAGRCYP